jgi:hypothetical protein
MVRGMLSLTYPKALYVTSAVWRAQQEDIVAREDRSPAVRALLGYQLAVRKLAALRERLVGAEDPRAPSFAIILLGPMLWTRYERTPGGLSMTPHVDGPKTGDVVVVTDEPVIEAMVEGRLTTTNALELGLIRYYGDEGSISALSDWLANSLRKAGATHLAPPSESQAREAAR